jgi:hypothetical protein
MLKIITCVSVNVFIVSILVSSCAINRTASSNQLDISVVPADFNPRQHILLIAELPVKQNSAERSEKRTKEMEGLLKEYYPYKFEIVSLKDIRVENSKYTDTSVYKYAVLNSLRGHTIITTKSGQQRVMVPKVPTTYISFYFFDRVNNKKYENSYASAWLKTSVEAFVNTIKKAKKI